MFERRDDILAQLAAGPSPHAVFAETRVERGDVVTPAPDDVVEELVALANANGGGVFFGVRDDGSVQGLTKDEVDAVEAWLVSLARDRAEPPLRPALRRALVPRADGTNAIILVAIVAGGDSLHRTNRGRWLIRVGTSKRDLTADELPRLVQRRARAQNYAFEEEVVARASPTDLDDAVLEQAFPDASIPRAELLRKTRVLTRDSHGDERPTVAGLLAFGRAPTAFLPQACVEAAAYAGAERDSAALFDARRIEGAAGQQLADAIAFVEKNMRRPATKDVGRLDHPQYDTSAVYEAVMNALAHRDYSLRGAKTRLYLFADRLELYSPGALPNSMVPEELPHRVVTRNQLLVDFLRRIKSPRTGRGYLESRGEGVRRMSASERHAGVRPEYRLFSHELLLTIWAKPSPHAAP